MKKIKRPLYFGYTVSTTIPSDAKLTLNEIARLWVRWNIKEITGDELSLQIHQMLKAETAKAWDEFRHPPNNPLESLLI